MKVLIIDDDSVSRLSIARMLEDSHAISVAPDGRDGLLKAAEWQPDAILLDVEMPGKNGYEVCDILKRMPETSNIPVLFLSGRSSLRERLQGYEAGGDDYLVKPCEADELKAKLTRLESLHAARQQLHARVHDASRGDGSHEHQLGARTRHSFRHGHL